MPLEIGERKRTISGTPKMEQMEPALFKERLESSLQTQKSSGSKSCEIDSWSLKVLERCHGCGGPDGLLCRPEHLGVGVCASVGLRLPLTVRPKGGDVHGWDLGAREFREDSDISRHLTPRLGQCYSKFTAFQVLTFAKKGISRGHASKHF